MTTFDAPDRETCQVSRARTNTPLQALVLMNDVQFIEAARKFAERVMKEGGQTADERIAFAYRAILSRRPTDNERATVRSLLQEHLKDFKAHPEEAKKFLAAGESPRDEQLEVTEHAAWSMITHLVFNLSETVTKG